MEEWLSPKARLLNQRLKGTLDRRFGKALPRTLLHPKTCCFSSLTPAFRGPYAVFGVYRNVNMITPLTCYAVNECWRLIAKTNTFSKLVMYVDIECPSANGSWSLWGGQGGRGGLVLRVDGWISFFKKNSPVLVSFIFIFRCLSLSPLTSLRNSPLHLFSNSDTNV